MTEIKKEPKDGPMGEEKHSHPAFGVIGLSQTGGNAVLVGSAVKHQHYISLTIKEAVRYKNEYHDRYHGTKEICRVYMSHAQLAEMLFSMNHGDGVPCTISHVVGDEKGYRPEPPYESPMKQSSDDLKALLNETLQKAKDMAREAEALLKTGVLKKADRERMRFLAMKIAQDIESNLPFAARCMDEKIEKNIAHAKTEIESFVDMKLKITGIEHYRHESPLLIESESSSHTETAPEGKEGGE